MAKVDGGIVDGLFGSLCPEFECVAGSAALEALVGVLFEVGGEAAACAGGRAMQGAWPSLLGASDGFGLEAQELQDRGHGDGGPDSGEVDGGT